MTFGLSAAPNLALWCLKQLADDEGHWFSRASSVLQRDFYIDDVLIGANTKEEVLSLRKELTDLLQSVGLNIGEWASNDQGILQGLSERDKSQRLQLSDSNPKNTRHILEFPRRCGTYNKAIHQFCDRQNLRSTRIARASDHSSNDYTSTSLVVEGRLG